MYFIKADEIYTRECCGKMMTRVTLQVDELCKYNTSYVDFLTFCLMNDLLKKVEKS